MKGEQKLPPPPSNAHTPGITDQGWSRFGHHVITDQGVAVGKKKYGAKCRNVPNVENQDRNTPFDRGIALDSDQAKAMIALANQCMCFSFCGLTISNNLSKIINRLVPEPIHAFITAL